MVDERTAALGDLKRLCAPDSLPLLDDEELLDILDRHLIAGPWEASKFYKARFSIYPTTRTGVRYLVVGPGTTGETEPDSWPTLEGAEVTSGTVKLVVSGPEPSSSYDMTSAARVAWQAKAGKASRYPSTGGMNMSKIFDNCMKMAETFNVPLLG